MIDLFVEDKMKEKISKDFKKVRVLLIEGRARQIYL